MPLLFIIRGWMLSEQPSYSASGCKRAEELVLFLLFFYPHLNFNMQVSPMWGKDYKPVTFDFKLFVLGMERQSRWGLHVFLLVFCSLKFSVGKHLSLGIGFSRNLRKTCNGLITCAMTEWTKAKFERGD